MLVACYRCSSEPPAAQHYFSLRRFHIDEEDFACPSSSLHSQLFEQPLLELSHCMRLSMPPRMNEIVANVADTVADMPKRADQLTAGQLLLS
jgi:hypothetical protein